MSSKWDVELFEEAAMDVSLSFPFFLFPFFFTLCISMSSKWDVELSQQASMGVSFLFAFLALIFPVVLFHVFETER